MRKGQRRKLSGSAATAIVCAAAAICLLAGALSQPKYASREGWVPLNKEVEAALAQWDKAEEQQSAANVNRLEANETESDNVQSTFANQEAAVVISDTTDESAGRQLTGSAYREGLLDINRATAEQLTALPGIGPAKAQAIVSEREKGGFYTSAEDLLRVKGIGPKILERIKENIVVRP